MFKNGRSDRIRTCGLLVPNQAHYQTVPHPGVVSFDILLTCAIGEGTEPPNAALRLRLRTYQTVPHPGEIIVKRNYGTLLL